MTRNRFLVLWMFSSVVLVAFGFMATNHYAANLPFITSNEPADLERQLIRRIDSLQGERVSLRDEQVAGRLLWLVESMQGLKGKFATS